MHFPKVPKMSNPNVILSHEKIKMELNHTSFENCFTIRLNASKTLAKLFKTGI